MTPDHQPFALYNPALLPPEMLLAEFTARRPLLDTLLGIIRSNRAGHPPQHCLIIGPRGAGKTTTLWAIAHSVTRDTELSRLWQPVVFDEESRRVGDLADFWLEAIRQWEHATQSKTDRANDLLLAASADIEEQAQRTFLEMVERSGRAALLLIDNLNDLLAAISDPQPLHRLRAFLMRDSRVMIVGGATRYFDAITSIDQPFNDFFRTFDLRPLTLDEMRACLLALADSRGDTVVKTTLEGQSTTIRTLHLLTGGNPRLIKTFYRLLRDGLHGDVRAHLEKLLDEFTPYFKAIVDALPAQQQRILDAVALAWDPVEVATVSTATRLPSNQVSAQLRALLKSGVVSQATDNPKRKTYLLTDRFSNIHYLMRHGRVARNRLDWFVALVRLVFSDVEAGDVLARVAREAAECGPDGQRDARAVLQSALDRAESPDSRRRLLHATLKESWDGTALESLDKWFDTERAKVDLPEVEVVTFFRQMPTSLRKQLGYQPTDASWWIKLTEFLKEKRAWHLAEAAFRKAIEIRPADVRAWTHLAFLLEERGRLAEAEAVYRQSLELQPADAVLWTLLGNVVGDLGRFAEAESMFRKAVVMDSGCAYAWTRLGELLLEKLDRPGEAEAALRTAVNVDPAYAYAWTRLGDLLRYQSGHLADAEVAYRRAIEVDVGYHFAWNDLGELLAQTGRVAEAETAFRRAIELAPGESYPRRRLAELLSQRGGADDEARKQIRIATVLRPESRPAQELFIRLCGNDADDLRAALPDIGAFVVAHADATAVFEFAVGCFVRLARITSPSEALSLLNTMADVTPFETLRDAFIAFGNHEHLQRLAPERRNVAIELLNRLSDQGRKAAPRAKARPRGVDPVSDVSHVRRRGRKGNR